jgi:hypothetical protein
MTRLKDYFFQTTKIDWLELSSVEGFKRMRSIQEMKEKSAVKGSH